MDKLLVDLYKCCFKKPKGSSYGYNSLFAGKEKEFERQLRPFQTILDFRREFFTTAAARDVRIDELAIYTKRLKMELSEDYAMIFGNDAIEKMFLASAIVRLFGSYIIDFTDVVKRLDHVRFAVAFRVKLKRRKNRTIAEVEIEDERKSKQALSIWYSGEEEKRTTPRRLSMFFKTRDYRKIQVALSKEHTDKIKRFLAVR